MKKLFLDVDGVLLCYDTAFHDWLNQKVKKGNLFGRHYPILHNIQNHPELSLNTLEREFLYSGTVENFTPLVKSSEFNDLSRLHETFLVTNMPNKIIDQRIRNLENLGFEYSKIICAGLFKHGEKNYPLKSEVIRKEWDGREEIYFLDDLPENCEEVKANIPEANVVLMDSPYNKEAVFSSHIPRVFTWAQFQKIVFGNP